MALAARLTFRDSRGCLCIRRREREHRERQQNQCRRADESTYNRKFDRFRISHCRSPVYSNILHKACPSRTDHNRMAAPSNIRITGVHASRAAGGVTGTSRLPRNQTYRCVAITDASGPGCMKTPMVFSHVEFSSQFRRYENHQRSQHPL